VFSVYGVGGGCCAFSSRTVVLLPYFVGLHAVIRFIILTVAIF